MKRIPTFVAGMLTAAVIGALGVGALAASGAVTFNASNLQLNGQQISAKGENYTLANGQQVPASITYTDETGGGTTYLPVRRISELLGVETGWDSTTGSVTVGKAPDTATPTDYSDWSAEEEAAYQEFKGMWEVEFRGADGSGSSIVQAYNCVYSGSISKEDLNQLLNDSYEYASRLAEELNTQKIDTNLWFFYGDTKSENFIKIFYFTQI